MKTSVDADAAQQKLLRFGAPLRSICNFIKMLIKVIYFRQRELAIQSAVHQLSQSERWNTLSPIEQQQVTIKLNIYFYLIVLFILV